MMLPSFMFQCFKANHNSKKSDVSPVKALWPLKPPQHFLQEHRCPSFLAGTQSG